MNSQTLKLLREAAEWRLIGLLFECPGNIWKTQVQDLVAEITDSKLRVAAESAQNEATEAQYHTTFGPGGPAASREVSYRKAILPGQLLSELGTYYRAFAYQPVTADPPDHIAVEAGFVAYLRLKEAYAQARGDTDQASVTAEAADRFIADHLDFVAEPLAQSLVVSGLPYLAQASTALLEATRLALLRRQRGA